MSFDLPKVTEPSKPYRTLTRVLVAANVLGILWATGSLLGFSWVPFSPHSPGYNFSDLAHRLYAIQLVIGIAASIASLYWLTRAPHLSIILFVPLVFLEMTLGSYGLFSTESLLPLLPFLAWGMAHFITPFLGPNHFVALDPERIVQTHGNGMGDSARWNSTAMPLLALLALYFLFWSKDWYSSLFKFVIIQGGDFPPTFFEHLTRILIHDGIRHSFIFLFLAATLWAFNSVSDAVNLKICKRHGEEISKEDVLARGRDSDIGSEDRFALLSEHGLKVHNRALAAVFLGTIIVAAAVYFLVLGALFPEVYGWGHFGQSEFPHLMNWAYEQ